MTTTRHDTQRSKPRAIVRVAAPSIDRDLAFARRVVLAAGFLVLLAVMLAHIGG